MIADILIPLVAISLAELGDKTQLSILLLSTKTKKHLHLLIGVMLAFLIVDGTAILFGSWIMNIIPINWLKTASGIIFILFGILILRQKETTKESKLHVKNSFLSGFILIFISEWGDKTQIASALFATQYNSLMVLTGVMTALTLLSITAIYLGKIISDKINKKLITKTAGTAFILIGIVMIASLLFLNQTLT
jgi:putative Ca2+/H+ antiporter (TMEM165/GDT1 family)